MKDSKKPAVQLTAQTVAPSSSPRVRAGVRAGAITIKQKVTE